jgi:hypothetical protein
MYFDTIRKIWYFGVVRGREKLSQVSRDYRRSYRMLSDIHGSTSWISHMKAFWESSLYTSSNHVRLILFMHLKRQNKWGSERLNNLARTHSRPGTAPGLELYNTWCFRVPGHFCWKRRRVEPELRQSHTLV